MLFIKKNKNDFILKINIDSYKVIKEKMELLEPHEIEYFKTVELDNTQLIEKHIENKNHVLAKKLLASFNIKKLKDKKELYSNQIYDLEINTQVQK